VPHVHELGGPARPNENLGVPRVVWDRWEQQETLNEFFEKELSGRQRRSITHARVEMWEPYRLSIEQWAPDCRIIYDKFPSCNMPTPPWPTCGGRSSSARVAGCADCEGKRSLLLTRWLYLTAASARI
jgi:hypothetical protein